MCGEREGLGSFYYADGSRYRGGWLKNLKDGMGLLVQADGRLLQGLILPQSTPDIAWIQPEYSID